jgi:hypothetical protein
MSFKKTILSLLALSFIAFSAEITVTDSDIPVGSTVTWTADNTYILDGIVFVDSLATLTIEPGTIIKAEDGINEEATALVVHRYAQIFAEGTAANPIIFTSIEDDLDGNLDYTDRGKWGGVILLGQATTNNDTQQSIEGVNNIDPLRSKYGGDNDAHSSGVFRYVSIRHTGMNIGSAEGNEIQGLTVGAVGSGTVIEYVESYASDDDGFEFFGGTVNTRYLVAAFCSDDAFDWDQGFRGKHQFWFGIQGTDEAGRVAEMDGAGGNEQGTPYAQPVLSNVTYLGGGVDEPLGPDGDGEQMLMFRDNTGGYYWNSIFGDYQAIAGNIAITVEEKDDDLIEDSENRMLAGDLALVNNIWFDFAAGSGLDDIAPQEFVQTHLAANSNSIQDPLLRGISRTQGGNGLDPRPGAGSPALTGAVDVGDDYFMVVDYRGAFGSENWLRGWTALDQLGYTTARTEVAVVDSDIPVGANVTWTEDNIYILDGIVFVDSLATLTIEPGTIIKAEDGINEEATALVVHRYAQIFAEGTAANPIIFTSIEDDLDGNLDYTDRGKWGGVILLGQATTNNDTQQSIEGVNNIDPLRSKYGGDNDAHSSGVFRYVSIRHTGMNIGSAEGNEIQGLTVGAVGSGTVIEYVESYASDDDGFEFFGGTVNTRYLVAAFCSDDAFDWDQGFRGKHQFWFGIQGTDEAGRVAEMDGAGGNEQGTPYAQPVLSNVTYLGGGVDEPLGPDGDGEQMLMFRDNTGGYYWNSIFGDYQAIAGNIAITVEEKDDDLIEDSENRMLAGDLALVNNIWFDFAAGSGLDDIAPQEFVQTHLAASGNTIEDPLLMGISREFDGMLDPRPGAGSPALTGAADVGDDYFMDVAYRGAFDPNAELWTAGWTALDQLNYTSYTSVDEEDAQGLATSFALKQNYPNPFNPTTTIEYTMAAAGQVNLTVYNIMGQKVAELVSGVKAQGTHKLTFDATSLSSGIYFYQLQAGNKVMTKRMTLIK